MNLRPDEHNHSLASWILAPAVVMSLGWGLRGYIGGGPFGAMIPGALVALLLCQYLRWNALSAAPVESRPLRIRSRRARRSRACIVTAIIRCAPGANPRRTGA